MTTPDDAAVVTVRGLEERDHQAVHDILTSDAVIEGTMQVPYSPLHSTTSRLLRRVGLIVFADNPRAIGLYESLGFQHEGVMREFGFKRGEYLDAVVMGRLRH